MGMLDEKSSLDKFWDRCDYPSPLGHHRPVHVAPAAATLLALTLAVVAVRVSLLDDVTVLAGLCQAQDQRTDH